MLNVLVQIANKMGEKKLTPFPLVFSAITNIIFVHPQPVRRLTPRVRVPKIGTTGLDNVGSSKSYNSIGHHGLLQR
jgi:hypothetical protein